MKVARYILVGAMGLAIAVVAAFRIYESHENPGRVAYMLNIDEPPQSMRVIDCESGPITDVVITCAIQIEPKEFPLLLAGYSFSESSASGGSHQVAHTKVGPEFVVATEFKVSPAKFKNGGAVTVATDSGRKNAIVDLYIE